MAISLFLLLCAGTFLVGFANAFVQQFRFAAADTASAAFRPRAISLVLAGGVVAAVLGPQTVIHTADLFASAPFAGAFLASAALTLLAALRPELPRYPAPAGAGARRERQAARRDRAAAGVPGGGRLRHLRLRRDELRHDRGAARHGHASPHRDAAVLGIQWHVLAMFGPSFVTGSLIARFGAERIVATGLLLLVGCALVALSGTTIGHFWLALVLLGVGWNFGFIGGTALVTETYRPEENEKVQALNDFLVFGVVALASFSSGEILVVAGWNVLNLVVLPVAVVCLLALFWRDGPAPQAGVRPCHLP